MDTYTSGNPRVHRNAPSRELKSAIREYRAKMFTAIQEEDRPFFLGLIYDLREELALRVQSETKEK